MSNVSTVLVVLALVMFLLAVIEWPPASSGRLTAAGLFLLTLSLLIGGR